MTTARRPKRRCRRVAVHEPAGRPGNFVCGRGAMAAGWRRGRCLPNRERFCCLFGKKDRQRMCSNRVGVTRYSLLVTLHYPFKTCLVWSGNTCSSFHTPLLPFFASFLYLLIYIFLYLNTTHTYIHTNHA